SFYIILNLAFLPANLLAGGGNQREAEKFIPIIEDKSFFRSEDQNYLFNVPSCLEVSAKEIFVLDTMNHRIQVFDLDGHFLRSIGQRGKGPGEFNSPEGLFVDREKGLLFVADTRNLRLQLLEFSGREKTNLKLNFAPVGVVRIKERIYLLAFPAAGLIQTREPLCRILDLSFKPIGSFLDPTKTESLITDLLVNSLIMKEDRLGNLVIARQFALNKVLIFNEKEKPVRNFEIIYKGNRIARPGIPRSIKTDLEAQKIAFLTADLAFDVNNNYYFLSGISGQLPSGQPEKGREIYQYDWKGNYLGTIILPTQAKLIAFGPDDSLYLIDTNYNLRKFRPRRGAWQ
ncbi:MAG: 6-bladed beta-propeller, partial [Candidatus Saccharicenans sp.]